MKSASFLCLSVCAVGSWMLALNVTFVDDRRFCHEQVMSILRRAQELPD